MNILSEKENIKIHNDYSLLLSTSVTSAEFNVDISNNKKKANPNTIHVAKILINFNNSQIK